MQNYQCRQKLRSRGICVVIPTYNNVGTIRDVVERALAYCDDVIVVNDGSNDGTETILREINDIILVDCAKNGGKGKALKRGFRKAKEKGFAYAITIDGDGQHFPEDIPLFLEANIKNPGCIIVGERNLENVERSKGSNFANKFSNFWFCVQTGHYLPDTQTGFRLYPLNKIRGLSFLTSRYEAELELLVFSSWHGVKIISVPINVYYPPKEERVSHFRPGPDFTRISILNTVLCILALVYGLPMAILRCLYTFVFTSFSLIVYLTGALLVLTPFARIYVPICKRKKKRPKALQSLLHWYGSVVMKLFGLFGCKVTVKNPHKENFDKPAILICNHQSHLDLMAQLSLTEKIVFLTNDWVWNSPYFGYVIRNAGYYPVSMGIENLLPKLRELVNQGYSISIFPEGTRSTDCSIHRFHKGAFLLAKELNLDIKPLILYGTGKILPKKKYYMRRWPIQIDIDRNISQQQLEAFGESEREICKWFRKYYISRYNEISDQIEKNV